MGIRIRVNVVQGNLDMADRINAILESRLDHEAEYLRYQIMYSLSVPYPPSSSPGTPPHERTGKLMQSIRWVKQGRYTRHIGSSYKVAYYMEFGTSGPYRISARRRGFLSFPGRMGQVYIKSVVHPGVRPRPFLLPALNTHWPSMSARLLAPITL